ncbi:MAG: histidine triad nucleotide-binding protein [Ignavibacteria bacterium GWF2_33_9]|nr:MAG: histidine triad nucleotide-binding protein [Ignavibacteria bacterium GWF2_33_9]
MAETIFKKIIDRVIPAAIVYEDDLMIAINDIDPKAPTHILIIPKKEIATINDVQENDAELIGKMILRAKNIAIEQGFSEDGYRLVFNVNEGGGQAVFHIHLHLLGGRKFTWPPG